MTFWRALRRALRAVLLALAAVILFIEEWGWRPLTAAVAWFAQWPPLARLEAALRRVPPRVALALFLVPAVLLFPVKLLALWLIHLGHAALGLGVIVAAKLLGTALVGRLFVLTEPQLVQFAWFARALGWWRATKARIKAAVLRSAGWRAVQVARRRLRVVFRRFGR
ncbi:MAG TPA: hypothetical protein VFL64_20185 [Rhizobacter sp.]|nr:hypothetical protein [Rhizobacter sp.]